MFLIYGWGNRQKPIANGNFQCPVCRGRTGYTHYSQRRWFSLFFVPLFPFTSPQEFVGCHQCNNVFSLESLPASHGIARVGTAISGLALGGMFIAFAALVTVCVFFISLPLSIAAVIMGHLGYMAVRKNQPYLEGGWQAIMALVVGYIALFLSSMIAIFFLLGPQLFPRPERDGTGIGQFANGENGGAFSAQRALSAAELMIATKQDLPPGRGNNPAAIRLANSYAEVMKRASDEAFTRSGKPILQLSGGEYLTYCELHEDRCLFLVHVPSYRNFTDEAKETLAQIAWINAQLISAGELPAGTRLAVGLRGTILYGDIMVGRTPNSTEDLEEGTPGEKDDLLAFFIQDAPKGNDAPSTPDEPAPSEADSPQIAEDSTSGIFEAFPDATEPSQPKEPSQGTVFSRSTEPSFPNSKDESSIAADDVNPFMSKNAQQNDAEEVAMVDESAEGDNPFTSDASKVADAWKSDSEANLGDAENSKSKVGTATVLTDAEELTLQSTIANDTEAFSSIAFSHDGMWLVGGKSDASVQVCDSSTGSILGEVDELTDAPAIVSVAISHDNQFVAAGCDTGAFFTWRLNEDGQMQEQQWTRPLENEIRRTIASPGFGYLMAGDSEGKVVWFPFRDAEQKERKFSGLKREVASIWLPGKGTEAMATDGKTVMKFSLKDGRLSEAIDLGLEYPQLAAFSHDGEQVLVADFDNIYLYNSVANEKLATIEIPNREQVHILQFHPNKKWFALGLKGRTEIWDLASKKVLAYAKSGTDFYDKVVAFSDDGRNLAVASDAEKAPIRIYEVGEMTP